MEMRKDMNILLDVDPVDWANSWGIGVLEPQPCLNCGVLLETTLPYEVEDFVGLVSKPHGCPVKFDHYSIVPKNLSDRLRWKRTFSSLNSYLQS